MAFFTDRSAENQALTELNRKIKRRFEAFKLSLREIFLKDAVCF